MSVYYKEKPEYLQLALESVINQTVKPNEIVLVQDGKLTEELQAVITKYQQNYTDIFKTYALQQNRGLGKALNFSKKRNPFNHMTVMFKKQAVQNVGGYMDMPYFEDYWLWVRMLKAGYKAKNVDKVLVKVRAGQEMIARRGGLNYAKYIIRFEKALQSIGIINFAEMICYIIMRNVIAIMPESLRLFIYRWKLRK